VNMHTFKIFFVYQEHDSKNYATSFL